MKIAVVVHGRFHAFELARELIERGHDLTVFTNYPRWAAARFGLPPERVRGWWLHGVLARVADRLRYHHPYLYPEAWLHRAFGRWAAGRIARERWDVVHSFSGVAEESLEALAGTTTLTQLVRGSAHICTQARLLREEETRTGARQDRPGAWIIRREEREYALAQQIVVLSSFALQSFVDEGVPAEKLRILPLGARLEAFRPRRDVVEARVRRILDREPLRVLYVGSLSFRKGLWDLAAAVEELGSERFRWRCVGSQPDETRHLVRRLRSGVELPGKVPQAELPEAYTWGDIFVLPTIEDGFAVVLAQAAGAALPILTTTNCSGPDLVREGETGWVVPIRSPRSIVERLRWCDEHRPELAAMAGRMYTAYKPRDWSQVAAELEALCAESLAKQAVRP